MAQNKRVGLKSALRGTHANYFDNLIDSVSTLQDGGVMAAGSVFGFGIQTVAAAGSDQAGAGAIDANGGTFVQVTGADDTKGVRLPLLSAVTAGTTYLIFNNLVNKTLEVYPGSGDAINPVADNGGVTIAADTIMLCIALDSAEWAGAELPVVGA
jgi:hypothetical protein